MDCKLKTLSNKLTVLTVPMPSVESATLTVWVKTGSRRENDKIAGISHFLEHMAFKGGGKYSSAKAVSEAIDSVGGEFNASTSKEWTQYYVRLRADKIEKAFDVLSDMLLRPLLKQSDIDREKGVIVEEIGMYEDMPMKHVWDLFEQLIFKGHSLGRDIIGTRETVKSLTKDDFKKYIDKHYYTTDMLVTVAGGVKESETEKLTEKYFGEAKNKNKVPIKRYDKKQSKPRIMVYPKEIEQAHLVLGFPADKLGQKERYADAVLNSVLSGGMSSRLFTEVREKRGLAYAVKASFDRYADTGYFALYAGVDPQKSEKAIKVILDQLYGLASKKYKISKKEFTKAKEYMKGHFALSLEDTRAINGFFGHEYLMLGKIRTPDEVYAGIESVSLDDVYERAGVIFNENKLNFTVIGPFKDRNKFDTIFLTK
ncbi:insulinase family protein [Candidatus Woesebacteria bacterium]|nr:insulinase family protein [Candidatus Woesebacteria bacterium]